MRSTAIPDPIADQDACLDTCLRYSTDAENGYSRVRGSDGFSYRLADGSALTDPVELGRIAALVIPPAWEDVWICADVSGHLQATGRDRRGRKQYRYHEQWRHVRDLYKFGSLVEFGRRLPLLRARVATELRRRTLDRRLVAALAAALLDRTLLRVGNPEYRRDNESFGLTTLEDEHAAVRGALLLLRFPGKSGKAHEVPVQDAHLVRLVKRCQELPGQVLFQYLDRDGGTHRLTSEDVNAFLEDALGGPFTSKDFRTWGGTAEAVATLESLPAPRTPTDVERNVTQAVKRAAAKLGNTPAVCRRSYIHPRVLESYRNGTFAELQDAAASCHLECEGLRPEELRLLALLQTLETRSAS
jgi:DNA topoisomerase-1